MQEHDDHYYFGARFFQSATGGHDYDMALRFIERGLAISQQPARRAKLYELQAEIWQQLRQISSSPRQ